MNRAIEWTEDQSTLCIDAVAPRQTNQIARFHNDRREGSRSRMDMKHTPAMNDVNSMKRSDRLRVVKQVVACLDLESGDEWICRRFPWGLCPNGSPDARH
jgi:hypothetical protein